VQLGEAQSKCQHISGVPLMPGVAKELYKIFLAKGALATTAIEGNTLTEEEVRKHIDGELKLPPSKEYLKQEVSNIIESCNIIGNEIIKSGSTDLTADKIKQYNSWILKDLPLGEDVEPGVIRKHSVGVGTYRGAPAEDREFLLDKLCKWLNKEFMPSNEDEIIIYGILKAIVCHMYIAWIHPFGDGNGRTARLLEFGILLSSGVSAPSAQLLSNHYNQTRSEYYRNLDMSHKSGGEIFPFIMYATQGFIDGLVAQLELIQEQQLHVHWMDYIHSIFSKDSTSNRRRRSLVIDMSGMGSPVQQSNVRHISPKIAEAYASLTEKTLTRDINALIELKLIVKTPDGLIANKNLMRAFLPPKRQII
jgi:Fic family protein